VDADAGLGVLDRGRPREADDAVLARAVGRGVRRAAQRERRRDVDDRAAVTVCEDRGDLGPHRQPAAAQVDGDDPVPDVDGIVVRLRVTGADAGAVRGAVETAEGVERGRHHRTAGVLVGDVGRNEAHLGAAAAQRGRGRFAGVRVDVGGDDPRAHAGQHFRRRTADCRGGA
jgi:hypothetical protein